MLFGTGDVPCIAAIAIFAACPAIRYMEAALSSLPASLVEVGIQIGATPRERLLKIELPAALPNILLAIAQVALMALAMVVVTALIGTMDLGQLIMLSVSKANPGQALAAGICVAVIGVIVDGLLTDKANQINAQRRSI
jgi:glycine betaine/proline transport system permease protein